MRTKLNLWARLALRRRAGQPRIMEAQIDERKTYAIDDMEGFHHRANLKLIKTAEKLEVMISKADEQLVGKDEWGITRHHELPIMKPNEVAVARKNIRNWWVATTILFLFDTYFASLIVPFILTVGPHWVKLVIGACVAFIIIRCCEVGFRYLVSYFEGRLLLAKGELTPEDKPKVNKKLAAAVGYIAAGVLATFFIAMVRFVFLETVDTGVAGHSPVLDQLHEKLALGARYASATTGVLAFIVVALFAFFSIQKNKLAIRYRLYKKYNRNATGIARRINRIAKVNTNFWHRLKDSLEASWSLMLDTRRILKRVVDDEQKNKESAYRDLCAQPGFQIDDDIYRVYAPVASCDRELSLYGIDESKEIRAIKLSWNTTMIRINTMVELYKNTHHYSQSRAEGKRYNVPGTVAIGLVLVSMFFLSSCDQPARTLNMIVFVDLSGSVNVAAEQFYLQIVRALLSDLSPGSTLKVLPIDASTEKGSTEFIDVRVPAQEYFENEFDPPSQKIALDRMRVNAFKDSVIAVVEAGFKHISAAGRRKDDRQETDVLGAFRLLGKYQDTGNHTDRDVVLILSDMMNCNKQLDIEHHQYTGAERTELVNRLPKEKLSKWHVFVLTGESSVSLAKYQSTKFFWKAYLKASQSQELVYESGATSIIFGRVQQLAKPEPSKYPFLN